MRLTPDTQVGFRREREHRGICIHFDLDGTKETGRGMRKERMKDMLEERGLPKGLIGLEYV